MKKLIFLLIILSLAAGCERHSDDYIKLQEEIQDSKPQVDSLRAEQASLKTELKGLNSVHSPPKEIPERINMALEIRSGKEYLRD